MAIITSISEHPRKPGRYVVEADGRELAVVDFETLSASGVRVGGAVTDSLAATLAEGAVALATYDRALSLLAFRARSARELRQRLVRAGEPEKLVDAAIERLTRAGLLNDADYARQLARSRLLGRGSSRRRLQQEMFKRGVDRTLGDEAIDEVLAEEDVDQSAIIVAAARKKARTLAKLDSATRRRRLYAFLARRGYDSDEIRRAMAEVLGRGEGEVVED